MINQPHYIVFLAPDDDSMQYYILDNAGNAMLRSFHEKPLMPLKTNPGGMADMKISFIKNFTLEGVNRMFTDPLTFISDSVQIIKSKFYSATGIGTETRIRVLIFEFNSQPQPGEAAYQKIIDMPIDLFKYKNGITSNKLTAPLLDGGFMQAYTAFNETEFVIPCDGSLSQNKRILFDGMRIPDVFNYQFSQYQTSNATNNQYTSVPVNFINNENDNYGIIKNNPGFVNFGGGYGGAGSRQVPWGQEQSGDFLISADKKTSFRIKGSVSLKIGTRTSSGEDLNTDVNLFLSTDTAEFLENSDTTRQYISGSANLVPNIGGPMVTQTFPPEDLLKYTTKLTGSNIILFQFDQTFTIEANQKLYMVLYQASFGGLVEIVSGNFEISFSSYATPTRCWAITLKDAMAYIIQEMAKASTAATGIVKVYSFESELLDSLSNLMLTSGAAVQASGNPDYGKYYRIFDIGLTPSSDITSAYGPVIKISFKDLLQICKVYCFGGIQISNNDVKFVSKNVQWDSSDIEPYDLGEVAEPEDSVAEDYDFTAVQVGAKTISFDQKSGLYDFNTRAEYVSTLLSKPLKYLDLTAEVCTSPLAIEKWRAGVLEAPTSITNNDNDNTTVLVNVDISQTSTDLEVINFTSTLPDYNLSTNTNIKLLPNHAMQPLPAQTVNGSYLSLNNDAGVFVFCEPELNTVKKIKVHYDGFFSGVTENALLGLSTDWVKIQVYINGLLFDEETVYAIGPNTPINYTTPTLNRLCITGDSIYIKVSSSITASGQLNLAQITVLNPDNSPYWEADGAAIPINPGSPSAFVPLSNQTITTVSFAGSDAPVMVTMFQYFVFTSILARSIFSYQFGITQWTSGSITESITYYLYKNGIPIAQINVDGTTSQTLTSESTNKFTETLQLGDVFWIMASMTNMNAQVTDFTIEFIADGVLCNPPLRVQYDVFTGFPNLATITNEDGSVTIRTDIATAPYNIEGLTWARIMDLWNPWIGGPLFDQANGVMQFVKSDKNSNLFTSYKGKIFKENNNISKQQMGMSMIIPRLWDLMTEVQIRFSQMYKNVVNKHIKFSIYGVPFYGFALSLDQSPTLNAAQKWQLLWSPKNDITKLINLNFDGIKYIEMPDNSLRINLLNPVQFVPLENVLPTGCHFPTIDTGLLKDRLYNWFQKSTFLKPWQIGDSINLQNFSTGLSPLTVSAYRICDGAMLKSVDYTDVPVNGLNTSITNYQVQFDTSDLPECDFYLVGNAGGADGSFIISEPMELLADQPDTLLISYTSTFNTQGVPFTTGYKAYVRVPCNIMNTLNPKLKAENFVDDEQNNTFLGAVPYDTLNIETQLIPDAFIKLLNKITSLDTWTGDNTGYTRASASTEWESLYETEGQPMRAWKLEVQESVIRDGYDVVASAYVDDTVLAASFDTNSFGNNLDNDADDNSALIEDYDVEL